MYKKGKFMKSHPQSFIIRLPSDNSPTVCSKCKITKEISDFYKHSRRNDGAIRYKPFCKKCRSKGPRKTWIKSKHENRIELGEQCCKMCQLKKPLNEFYTNGTYHDGTIIYRTRCKLCVNLVLAKQSAQKYKTKAEKLSASAKNYIAALHNRSSKRKLHLGFNIDCEYLNDLYQKQNGQCAISGVLMTYQAGQGRVKTNISLDRIDSSKGYIKGNVHLVCDLINTMKSNISLDEFYKWCALVIGKKDEKIQNT